MRPTKEICVSKEQRGNLWQEIPVHGGQLAAANDWLEREDPRYPKDPGDGSVPEAEKGRLIVPLAGSSA